MSLDYATLGESIRARRKELRLTQKQLAQKAETSQGYIADIEQGKAKNFSIVKIRKIAEAINMNLARLFIETENTDIILSDKEKELVQMCRSLDSEQRAKLEGLIEGMFMARETGDKKGA